MRIIDGGWVRLHRKLLKSKIFDNPNLLKFWIWILLKASHADHEQLVGLQTAELKKGEFVFGRKAAAAELGMSKSNAYKILNWFKSERMIDVKSNNKFSVVTVMNWELYQSAVDNECQQNDSKITTKEQQSSTNNNVKNTLNTLKTYGDLQSPSVVSEPDLKPKNASKEQELEAFFETLWKLYPLKKGKGKVAAKSKKVLYELGFDTVKTCIDRYVDDKPDWQNYQNGGTFFNSGYIDYLDKEYTQRGDNSCDYQNKPKIRKTSFSNFTQRDMTDGDFNELQRLENERLARELED